MNKLINHSEFHRFIKLREFSQRFRDSFLRHQNHPSVSATDYLTAKMETAGEDLKGQTVIYLDTKHWVGLRRVMLNPGSIPEYDKFLGDLETLRQKRRVCCPVSHCIIEELMKQSDPNTRKKTSELMDYLSGGICAIQWMDVIRKEFTDHVIRVLWGSTVMQNRCDAFTKVGFYLGNNCPSFTSVSSNERTICQKVYIDLAWDMKCGDVQADDNWMQLPTSFSEEAMRQVRENRAKVSTGGESASFREVTSRFRAGNIRACREVLLPLLATLCRDLPRSPAENVKVIFDSIIETADPWVFPTLNLTAAMEAAAVLSQRTPKPNDLLDYLHAASAIPYCDAFFCDNPMASLLNNKPLQANVAYGTVILSRPDEITEYLGTMK